MKKLILTDTEAQILVNALAAVTASGGGSREWALCQKLGMQTGLQVDDVAAVRYQIVAEREINEGNIRTCQEVDQIDHDLEHAVARLNRGSPDAWRG